MRHFRLPSLLPGAIVVLARGVGAAAAWTALIAPAGSAQGLNARLSCAVIFAVTMTMVAAAADEYGASAARTQVVSSRGFHRH